MTRHLTAGALVCALLGACGGTEPNGIDVGAIVVAPNPIQLMQQQTAQLQISVLDPDGALLPGVGVTFSSGDPTIVTVSNVGLVTSVGKAGTTTVAVKAGNKIQPVPVTVTATSSSIEVGPEISELPQLGSLLLNPVLLDLAGDPVPEAPFTYSTTSALIEVDPDGLVTSLGKAGVATVLVMSGEISATKAVTVTQVPTGIRLAPDPVRMLKGKTIQLAAVVVDAVGDPMPAPPATFTATPATLLSVSPSGMLTAAGHAGTGSAAATSGTLSATIDVSVLDLGALEGVVQSHIVVDDFAYGVAISTGGAIFGVSVGGTLYRGNLSSSTMTSSQLSGNVTIGVAVNNAGSRVYVTGSDADGLIEVDAATGERLRSWPAPADNLLDVVLSPDEQTIYVGGGSGMVYSVDATTFQPGTEYVGSGVGAVHLLHHPTQPLLYVSGVGAAREINTATSEVRTFSVGNSAQASALALSGDRLIVAGEGGSLDAIDLSTGEITSTTLPECAMYDIVATPDGAALLTTCTAWGTVKLLDPATLTAMITIPTGGDPRRAAISADGTRAVVANQAGWFDIIR